VTENAVITASPIPIRRWVPIIPVKTAVSENVEFAPIAYWSKKPMTAAGTEINAAMVAAVVIDALFFGSTFFTRRNTP
jgi:hypothetical protein